MRLPFRFYQGHRASSVLKAVVANEVSIGALDRVENGGTLVADKFKSNGVLINLDISPGRGAPVSAV